MIQSFCKQQIRVLCVHMHACTHICMHGGVYCMYVCVCVFDYACGSFVGSVTLQLLQGKCCLLEKRSGTHYKFFSVRHKGQTEKAYL